MGNMKEESIVQSIDCPTRDTNSLPYQIPDTDNHCNLYFQRITATQSRLRSDMRTTGITDTHANRRPAIGPYRPSFFPTGSKRPIIACKANKVSFAYLTKVGFFLAEAISPGIKIHTQLGKHRDKSAVLIKQPITEACPT